MAIDLSNDKKVKPNAMPVMIKEILYHLINWQSLLQINAPLRQCYNRLCLPLI
jgi:hypothetical protein